MIVDRFDRRAVMIASDLVRVPLVLALPLASWTWLLSIYPLLFLINAAAILHRPAKMAAIPSVVRGGQLTTANSLSSLAESLGDIGGYPLAGLLVGGLVAAFGTEQGLIGAFAVAALGYLCSAAVLWPLRLPRHERLEAASVQTVWSDLFQGIRFLVGNRLVRVNTAIVALGAVAIGMAMPSSWGMPMPALSVAKWHTAC